MARQQKTYSFEGSRHSRNGIAATVLGTCSVAVLAGLLIFGYLSKGVTQPWVGAVGFTGLAMSVGGLKLGFTSFHDDCKYFFFSRFGTIWCTCAFAAWFLLFCVGLLH